jgi:hypothetical protein
MPSILDPIQNSPFYSLPSYQISTPQGYLIAGNGVSIDQFGFLNVASGAGGTVTSVIPGTGLIGAPITVSGTISLAPATNTSLGGVKVGANLTVAPDGTISALPPGTGTISGVVAGGGLTGGGTSGVVTLSLSAASTTQFGGVSISPSGGISITSGAISLASATTTQIGGVRLATSAEVIAGTDPIKAVTPAALQTKVASTTASGLVQLSDSVVTVDSTKAATSTAVKNANDAAVAAQATASAALPKAGGVMTGIITFALGQTFPGVALPKATTTSLGVVQVGAGLAVNSSGVISTLNNGTVTGVTAGPGLGAPATGNTISTSGTLRLVAPTGTSLGGVKAGANITIGTDGTLGVTPDVFLQTNNPFSFNGYQWPIPDAFGFTPGNAGQVLTILNKTSGEIGWTNSGTLNSVVAGAGISVVSTPTTATVSLASVPSLTTGTFGATALIPTFTVNAYGQLTSTGLANPYPPFQNATQMAPPSLVLDFTTNDTNWKWTLQGNTTFENPTNSQPGMTGCILLTQNPTTPAVVTWGTAWKFANLTPYTGNPTAGTVDLIQFIVVSPTYIIVTNIVQDIG